MNKIRKHGLQLWRSKFARSVAIVASGTAAAQIITVAFSPIITRLYGPEAFGLMGTFSAILTVLVPLTSLCYPIATVLPKKDSDAKGIIRLSIYLAIFTSVLALILLLLFRDSFVSLLNITAIGNWIYLIPLGMLLAAISRSCEEWALRKKLFKIKATVAIWSALINNVSKSGIGVLSPIAPVLISITTATQGLTAVIYTRYFKKLRTNEATDFSTDAVPRTSHSLSELKKLAVAHKDFAIYRTPRNVLYFLSQSLPILLLANFYGGAAVGFYSISKSVLALPISLIGTAVANVFYPHFNEAVLEGRNSATLLYKATLALAILAFIPFALIFLYGPWLFEVVFGQEWRMAGNYAQWLAISSFTSLVAKPSTGAIPVLRMQGVYLAYEIGGLLVRVAALWIALTVYSSDLYAVIAYSAISAVLNLFLVTFVIFQTTKIDSKDFHS